MSKTRAELRVMLARLVGRHFAGTATGGSTTTLIDTAGLVKWTEADALKGGWILITAAGGSPPEGESRRIKAFDASTKTITFDAALSSAIDVGDGYNLYLAPIDLESWNECINQAIREAWPDVFVVGITNCTFSENPITLPTATMGVIAIRAVPEYADAGYPPQVIPRHTYTVYGDVGQYYLELHTPPSNTNKLQLITKGLYGELASEAATTELSLSYLMPAARALWHERMAAAGRGQADQAAHLQLMNHWQQIAQERKARLSAELLGGMPLAAREKKK